ncbi:hypothetical protein G7Y89_g13695 [Cudoniella acicularis]|uniref:Uncharacterized protein n=1 Tax=Cudoniella acicularis TaxID=354080 RepID=A0A8H4VVS8_9HELO|nr:hypothetical protein G7Y89_g13695 [Cudoniella acicularis]
MRVNPSPGFQFLPLSCPHRSSVPYSPFAKYDRYLIQMAAPKIPHRYLYTFKPLTTPRSFRLLRFRDFLHSELCELETFEIDNCPPFSTLSYTWGAPLNTAKSEEHYKAESSKEQRHDIKDYTKRDSTQELLLCQEIA